MKEPKGITSLSYGAIACDIVLLGLLIYNTRFYMSEECIAFLITAFGLLTAISYAVQLLMMRKAYYRHRSMGTIPRIILHICRVIQLLYSLAACCLVTMDIAYEAGLPPYARSYESKKMAALAIIVIAVTLNLMIFFKGWRLLKFVRRPYIDQVMSSFD